MWKSLAALALGGVLFAETALAGRPCAAPAAPTAPATAPAPTAQAPQARRSYSYEPTMQTTGGMSRYRIRSNHNTFGMRSAGSKVTGGY